MRDNDFLPVDRRRIELIEDHELRFWMRELACSAEHLLDAIEAVGVDTEAVAEYLAMRQYVGSAILPGQGRQVDGRP